MCCACSPLAHSGLHDDLPSPTAWLPLAGEKLALDELGPLIVTADGSLRRISNWAQLSEAERRVALKRLASRNRARLATLEEQQAAAQAAAAGQPDTGTAQAGRGEEL